MGVREVLVQKNVLFMNVEGETGHSLIYLLRMKGCKILRATTTDEVINWVAIRALTTEPLDLLVIDNFTLSRKTWRLLAELSSGRMNTPVLIVNRLGETPAIEKLLRSIAPGCPFILCEPGTVFATLDRFFESGRAF
jgi:DNA-binding response OmpR family regulator